jgi:2-dehydropantoate 2-reductase
MKIAVFGAGGVGGYFGARLAKGGADVHLIARGAHLEALRAKGLRVRSENGNLHFLLPATAKPDEVGPVDLVLFAVKSTDTMEAAKELGPLLGDDTTVLSVQNGIDNEERIAEVVGKERVAAGVAYIFATIGEPGVIEHQGQLARLVFGEWDASMSERLERFLEACRAGGIDAELSRTIRAELWRKYAMICATAGMTAAARLPIGEIRASKAAFDMYERIAGEVLDVAAAEDVELPDDTLARMVEIARNVPGHWYTSLHYDLTHGKPMELDALHGEAVRRARAHGIEAPMCEAIYGILEPWAIRNRQSAEKGIGR